MRGFRAFAASLIATCAALATTRAHASPATTSPEQGYDLGEIQSPRALAFGGAQSALGASTTALYGNPANLPQARVYHFEGVGALSPEARRESVGGAVVDSNTSRLSGGIGGTWSQMDPDGIHRVWTDIRLALAYPVSERLSFGAALRYLRVAQSAASGPLGGSLASDGTPGGPLFNNLTFDAGASVCIDSSEKCRTSGQGLRLGLVGKNLTNPGTGLAPTTVQGGVGYAADIFAVEGDALVDFTTWSGPRARYMLGGEVFLASHFPVRLGYRYDDGQKTHAVSAGLGYVERRFAIELGGRHDVAGDHPSTMISLGLRYFYEAASNPAMDDGEGIGVGY